MLSSQSFLKFAQFSVFPNTSTFGVGTCFTGIHRVVFSVALLKISRRAFSTRHFFSSKHHITKVPHTRFNERRLDNNVRKQVSYLLICVRAVDGHERTNEREHHCPTYSLRVNANLFNMMTQFSPKILRVSFPPDCKDFYSKIFPHVRNIKPSWGKYT